jgi:hypothetical protein
VQHGYRQSNTRPEPASVALKYNDIIAMKRAERSVLVKGMDVVYIYHEFLDGKSDFGGFAPRESIRIKMNGGGMNFVHGGISLYDFFSEFLSEGCCLCQP